MHRQQAYNKVTNDGDDHHPNATVISVSNSNDNKTTNSHNKKVRSTDDIIGKDNITYKNRNL